MRDKLRTVLKTLASFEEGELDKIVSCFKPKSMKRNTLLLREGEICKAFYYLYTGSIRTYFMDRTGREKTLYVMLDCTIGTAMTSFISQRPSFEFIEVLEDSEMLSISHHDFFRLNREIDHLRIFYQKIREMAFTFQTRKIETLVTLTAKQRYELLLQESPAFIQRLSNRILATYLDVREETLSRLKST